MTNMASSQIAQLLFRPVAQFQESEKLTSYLSNNHSTSLLACFNELGPSAVNLRVCPEGSAAFELSNIEFAYRMACERLFGRFTADLDSRISAVFKQTSRLEPFVYFLGQLSQELADTPMMRLSFIHGSEDAAVPLSQAASGDIIIIMDFDGSFKASERLNAISAQRRAVLLVIAPGEAGGTLPKGEADNLAEFSCIYYNQIKNADDVVCRMLRQAQDSVALQAARRLGELLQKATFTASTFANLKNMLFTKKPEGFGHYSKDEINVYSGDLMAMCQQYHQALSFYETAQRSHDRTIELLAAERICRIHLILASMTKQFEVFKQYGAWLLETLRGESSNLILKRRAVVFLFVAMRDCDLYSDLSGKMLVFTSGIQAAHCNLHAYNYFIKFSIKRLDYLLTSARFYAKGEEWALASAISQDLLRKIVRLKSYEPGKQAALFLQSESFRALGMPEKAAQACAQIVGIGEKKPVFEDISDELRCHVYEILEEQCIQYCGCTVVVNNLGTDLRDYSAVAGGSIHVEDMEKLIEKDSHEAYRAAIATQQLLNGKSVAEVDAFQKNYAYRPAKLFFGADLANFGLDNFLAGDRLCETASDLAVNNGLFGPKCTVEAAEPCGGDAVKLVIELNNKMEYSVFALDKAELVAEHQKLQVSGEFRAKNGAIFAIVFEFEMVKDIEFTQLILMFRETQIVLELNICLQCSNNGQHQILELKEQLKAGQICEGTLLCGTGLISTNAPECVFMSDVQEALDANLERTPFSEKIWSIFTEKNTKIEEMLEDKKLLRCQLTRHILRKLQYQLLNKSRKTSYMRFKKCGEVVNLQFLFVEPGSYCIKFYMFANQRLRLLTRTFQVADVQLPKPQLIHHGPDGFDYRLFVYYRGEADEEVLLSQETVVCKEGVGIMSFARNLPERSLKRNIFNYYESLFYEQTRASLILFIDEKMERLQANVFVESSELREQHKMIHEAIDLEKSLLSAAYHEYYHNCHTIQPFVLCAKRQQIHAFEFKTLKLVTYHGLILHATNAGSHISILVRNLRPIEISVLVRVSEGPLCLVSGVLNFEVEVEAQSATQHSVDYCGEVAGTSVIFSNDDMPSFIHQFK